ncbi:MAG TPA: FTR1 family protein [Polyangiales bacterium]|nr:FTR1 family protein [Polyangiales bacterium]
MAGLCAWAQRAAAEPARDGLRQIAGILDYIGGDYRGAVAPDGRILDQAEYNEQLSLAEDADALASQAGLAAADPVRAALGELSAALTAKAAPERVQNLCRKAREVLVTTQHLSLVPGTAPARAEAAQLYRSQGCTGCHGEDGSANTPTAAGLDPKPANFLDAERVAAVSPHRAFHALTFGVPGTAMVAYAGLSDAQRWGLAFYVLSLRHQNADLRLGRQALEGKQVPDFAALSSLTDEDLLAQLSGLPEAEQHAALAYLRLEAPFARAASGRALAALPLLDKGLSAYASGDRAGARKLFISAYLDGFEPHEAGLRARNAGLVSEIETSMLALRIAASEGRPLDEVSAAAERARVLLLRAEDTGSNATTALLGSLTITLREGLEIVLLVAALLGLVRKRGYPQLAKHVHAGWIAAIPAGLLTYYLAGSILGGMERELAEGIASLLAAVVLLGVTHWMLGQITAKKWVGFLAKRVSDAATSRSAALFVLLLAFVAAYREAFEIVLFYQALVLDAGEHVRQIWIGTGIGIAILLVIAGVLLRVGQKLRPAPFMLASSVFLALLSFMLVGKGIRALQEAAVIGVHPLPLPELQWLGIYATREGLIAQGALLLLLIGSAVWPWWSARRSSGLAAPAE